jgi:ribonuclease BN (tRNA processing enzyme)
LTVKAAPTVHGAANFAYRFSFGCPATFAISGDGALTDETRELFSSVEFLIHEGFYVDQSSQNHASIKDVVDYAIEARIPEVAIVHVNREERKKAGEIADLIERAKAQDVRVFLPEDHDFHCLYDETVTWP